MRSATTYIRAKTFDRVDGAIVFAMVASIAAFFTLL